MTTDVDVVGIVAGLLGGFVLSLVLWWITTRLLAPDIRFSSQVSRVTSRVNDKPVYRVELENIGKRGIVDLTVHGRVRYPGVSYYKEDLPENTHSIVLATSLSSFMRLRPGKKLHIRFYPHETIEEDKNRPDGGLYRVAFNGVKPNGELEQLLKHDCKPYMVIDVLCYDAFSGARKHFRSPNYRHPDIVHGKFKDGQVVAFDVETTEVA